MPAQQQAEFFRFNSTLVQLKVSGNYVIQERHIGFNSTLVQLKARTNKGCGYQKIRFNSTLVQLKVDLRKKRLENLSTFQFYLSSIKSPLTLSVGHH